MSTVPLPEAALEHTAFLAGHWRGTPPGEARGPSFAYRRVNRGEHNVIYFLLDVRYF